MTSFVYTWNSTFLATPADTELENLGAQRIRDTKSATGERVAVDHSLAGDTNDGKHVWATLMPQVGYPFTLDAGNGRLFSATVSGIAELFYQNSSGGVLQLTNNNNLYSTNGLTVNNGPTILNGSGTTPISGAGWYEQTTVAYNVGGTITYSLLAGAAIAAVGGFYALSDGRRKSDVQAITAEQALDWIMKGRPVTFQMGGSKKAGFIAQDDILNGRGEAISFMDDTTMEGGNDLEPEGVRLMRDYSYDNAYLTAAIQALVHRIMALEANP
jgi:endosialidase-like protein